MNKKPIQQENNKDNNGVNKDTARQWDNNDPKQSNVDSHKPQFERNNLQPDQEKSGTGDRK